jgi:type II secretory pathway component GspD/PulD (secretin)
MHKIIVKRVAPLIFTLCFLIVSADTMAAFKMDSKVTFNFVDIDLPVITKFVSEITHKNFILDERVKGKITIIAPTKLSVAETFNLFTAVLEMKGFTVVPSGVDAYSIIPTSEAKQKGLKFDKEKKPVNASYAAQLIPLKYISAGEVMKLVQPLISRDGYISVFGPGNLLLVIDSGVNIANVQSVIDAIDKPSESRGSINIYFLENADATELSKVLETVIKSAQTQPQKQPSVASAFESVSGITITADKASNALVIVASPSDYQNILPIIKNLDKRRRQVFVEVMIAEISVNKLLTLGTKWRAAVRSGGEPVFVAGVGTVDQSTISSIVTGLTGLTMGGMGNYFTIPQNFISGATSDVTAPGIAVLFSLSDFRDAVNVLSTPQILTSDNKEAQILVGENVPFISSRQQDVTTANTVLNNITRQDVGIQLKITPQISEGDYIKLDIYQEISALLAGQSDTILTSVGPTITKRSTKTSVVAKDRQTVVIGGLMQDREEETTEKAPFFGDLPLIGWLFKYKTTSKTKTNLLVFLTPHVVTEADNLGRLSRDKLNDFTQKEKLYVEGELIVTFKSGVTEEIAKSVIARQKASVIKTVKENTYRIKLKEGRSLEEATNKFSALPEVQKVEPINVIQIPSSAEELSRSSVPSSATSETSVKPNVQPPAFSPAPSVVAKETPVKPNVQTADVASAHSSSAKEASSDQNVQSMASLPVGEKKFNAQTKGLLEVAPSKVTKSGKYAIQVIAYPEAQEKEAMKYAENLKRTQPDVHVERVEIRNRGIWYRILTGHFANIEGASNYMKENKISKTYPGSFVQLKSEERSSKPEPE